ncbi:hypothetical protein ACLB2K_066972 [Fragaria x ananassa]
MISPKLRNFEGLISTELLDSDEGSNLEAFARASHDDSLCWEDVVGWLKSITNLPILMKGILTHEDARKAVEVGVAGIVVSNHGARQLDYSHYTPASISVLEEVVQAVGGKVPVLFYGGIRRGTDVFKALALAAQAVLVGRPVIFGLAADGEDGVRKVMKMLKDELELTMALSGCPSVQDITGATSEEQNNIGFPKSLVKGQMASEPVNVNEFQELARQVLPKMYYAFYTGGAEDQFTLKENVEAFRKITLRPRVLVDVSRIDMSTTILGYRIAAPIMIAPSAMHQLAHPEGEVATARAAAASNTILILSYNSTCTVEEVASSCSAVRFFQLYIFRRRDISAQMVQRAEKNGYKAIVLTVDVPRLGRREADIKNKMVAPQLKNFEGLISTALESDEGSNLEAFARAAYDDSLCWEGILTQEDARKAVEVGVAGIVVSNHGARQLDFTPATISVLEEVVQAVGGKVPVLFDGGIRRGTDVFKALALGAQAVLVGRPVLYGLAADGEDGVRKMMKMLKDELELTMALSGCPSVHDITRSHVRTECDRISSML